MFRSSLDTSRDVDNDERERLMRNADRIVEQGPRHIVHLIELVRPYLDQGTRSNGVNAF